MSRAGSARTVVILLSLSLLFSGAAQGATSGREAALAAAAFFQAGHTEEAVQAFTAALDSGELEGGERLITLNNRGVAWNELGDYDRGIADFEEALQLRPGEATLLSNLRIAFINRGDTARMLGEPESALQDYSRAIDLVPDDARAYGRRALLRYEVGDLVGARRDLDIGLAHEPVSEGMQALASRLMSPVEKSAEQ
jgi:tetratricopeptide (TPR) repeat protein